MLAIAILSSTVGAASVFCFPFNPERLDQELGERLLRGKGDNIPVVGKELKRIGGRVIDEIMGQCGG